VLRKAMRKGHDKPCDVGVKRPRVTLFLESCSTKGVFQYEDVLKFISHFFSCDLD
jgi:hypothetical protein